MLRLTGLWRSRTGTEVLSGKMTPNIQLLILPNTNKAKASEPDFIAYLAEPQQEGQDQGDQDQQEAQDRPSLPTQTSFLDRTSAKYG